MSDLTRGVLWMTGTLFAFTGMIVAVRSLTDVYGTSQIVVFRSLSALIILAPFLLRGGMRAVRTQRLGMHLLRNVVHFGGQWAWVYGVAFLTMAEVVSIEFTMPIWAALMAAVFLGERISANRVIATAVGFAGILVIMRPGLVAIHPAVFVVVGAAIGFAGSVVATKALTRTDSALAIIFWMNLMQLPMGGVLAAPNWAAIDLPHLPSMFLTGFFGLAAHYCMARSLSYADATIVLPIDFMRLPVTTLVAFLLYGERPSPFLYLGALMIFGGNYYSVWSERRRRKPQGIEAQTADRLAE